MTTADTQTVVTPTDSRNGEAGRLCVQRLVGRHSTATLYHCNNLDVLPEIRADLVITSPPYNLGSGPWKRLGNWKPGDSPGGMSKWRNGSDAGGGIQYGEHNDAMPWPEYVEWQQATLRLLWNCIGESGAIYYNHKPRVIGAKLWMPLELLPPEIILRQIITWVRPGGMNFNPTAFVPTMEWVMLLAKPDFRLKSRGASGIGDVWRMNPERNEHPAPFPVALPANAIESCECETVLDPYMGSGTTGIAAARLHRNFIGIERDTAYYKMACDRIAHELDGALL